MNEERLLHIRRFYSLLDTLEDKLGGTRVLAQCSKRSGWPQRGVYFFREPEETRSDSGSGPRIVRIGTHALKAGAGTTLWARLYSHKGPARSGGGNHRGSIFRLLVGNAVINRESIPDYPHWGEGSTASENIRIGEIPMEQTVTRIIGAMPFLWLAVDDEPGPSSQRSFIECNAIALLSNYHTEPLDAPSRSWLGQFCDRERVNGSGLWNQDLVDKRYDPAFLDTLEQLIHGRVATS